MQGTNLPATQHTGRASTPAGLAGAAPPPTDPGYEAKIQELITLAKKNRVFHSNLSRSEKLAFRTELDNDALFNLLSQIQGIEGIDKIGELSGVELVGRGGKGAVFKCGDHIFKVASKVEPKALAEAQQALVNIRAGTKLKGEFEGKTPGDMEHEVKRLEQESRSATVDDIISEFKIGNLILQGKSWVEYASFLLPPEFIAFDSGGKEPILIMKDGCDGKNPCSLEARLKKNQKKKQGFTYQEIFQIGISIAKGLEYLHNLTPKIIHGDLKPENILVQGKGNTITAKIIDFGSSHQFPFDSGEKKVYSGTPLFVPPEVWVKTEEKGGVNKSAHVAIVAEKLGEADMALPMGSVVQFDTRLGTYAGFKKNRFGANEHKIKFDNGETAVVDLKKKKLSVRVDTYDFYKNNGDFNEKADIYTFGMVMSELISGELTIFDRGNLRAREGPELSKWITRVREGDRPVEQLRGAMKGATDTEETSSLEKIKAELQKLIEECWKGNTFEDATNRPEANRIVIRLQELATTLEGVWTRIRPSPNAPQRGAVSQLAILFSHSSRIRCFLDMLYPTGKEESILQRLENRKEEPDLKEQNLYKFNNCVVFLLKEVDSKYRLFMKSGGSNDDGRIGLVEFGEMFDLSRDEICDEGVEVQIRKGKKIDGHAYISAATLVGVGRRAGTEERGGEESLRQLLKHKDLCIIRHGQAQHNEKREWHQKFKQDTSLTWKGIGGLEKVAAERTIKTLFSEYATKVIYISELLRTQQTAMIFVNCNASNFPSSPTSPIRLIMIPCNHEFKESTITRGACFHNQDERANWLGRKFVRKENNPKQDEKRKRTELQLGDVKSYFYRDDYNYEESADCKKTVFNYILNDKTTHYTRFYEFLDEVTQGRARFGVSARVGEKLGKKALAAAAKAKEEEGAAKRAEIQAARGAGGAAEEKPLLEQEAEQSDSARTPSGGTAASSSAAVAQPQPTVGGSLKKKRKKKRRTLRRKSKRLTKKRNKRKTNKKKRQTNKR